jgi:HAD superfamily hydrolase (TIGR01509 family)
VLTSETLDKPDQSAPGKNPGALGNIDLVIFDCDGVLIDSEPIASRTLAEALQRNGVAITPAEAHIRFTGNSESVIRRMCAEDFGIADVASLFADWHEHLFAEFGRSLAAMPGMEQVVASIQRPKCVASNSTLKRLRLSLGHLQLWQLFTPQVFSAEQVGRPKPAPDLLLYCAEQFSAVPEKCVMIDDSPHGVEAAIAAGMLAIGFVDPNDPRPQRQALLSKAGAFAVATGAGELNDILNAANRALAPKAEK